MGRILLPERSNLFQSHWSNQWLTNFGYNLYLETSSLAALDEAIAGEKSAIEAWRGIVASAGDVYSENLAFGVHSVGFPRHWSEELRNLERDFEDLLTLRRNAQPRADARPVPTATGSADTAPPTVEILPAGPAAPGRDYTVSVRAADPSGVKSLRLRYRHVTQYEDYESVAMIEEARTGIHTARIPAAFITPRWDLMFFVEAIDNHGNGRMYPDLEVETPYVIVPVKR